MAQIAGHRSTAGFVTIHAGFHGRCGLPGDHVVLHHCAVAVAAIDLRPPVPRMAEEDEVGEFVNAPRGKRPGIGRQGRQPLDIGTFSLHRAVARHPLRRRRKPRQRVFLDRLMTIAALKLQFRVPLVAEAYGFLRRAEARYGNEKATSESE